jgi:glucosamine kinase
MSLYLALDVGGTKTAATLADEEKILSRAMAGSIKTLRVLPAEAAANLRAVLDALETQSGFSLRGAVARTCVGTSGVSAPGVRGWLQAAFAEAVGGDLLLLGDEVIALDAAFAGGRGVLVIAGTGSNIVGRASTGKMVHTGGWGPALADEGSGHWIGTEALRACFRSIDAAPPSTADAIHVESKRIDIVPEHLPPLLRGILQALQLPTLDDLIGAANAPGFHSAALVPVVAAAAREGDLLARQVLLRAGRDLAGLAGAVIRKIDHLEAGSLATFAPPEVAFVGGVLSNIQPVRDAMHEALRQQFPGIALQQAAVDPLEGALWHARGQS